MATEGFLKLVDIMAGQFGKAKPADARRRALVAVSTMIGAMTMSRMVTDPELSAEILREAKASFHSESEHGRKANEEGKKAGRGGRPNA